MRQSCSVQPESFAIARRFDHEGVFIPMPDRMTVAARYVVRARATVHVNDAIRMRPSDIHDKHALQVGALNKVDTVGCLKLTGGAGRMAACVRFQFVDLAIFIQPFRPRLEGNRFDRGECGTTAQIRSISGKPNSLFIGRAPKVRGAVTQTRHWFYNSPRPGSCPPHDATETLNNSSVSERGEIRCFIEAFRWPPRYMKRLRATEIKRVPYDGSGGMAGSQHPIFPCYWIIRALSMSRRFLEV